MEPMRLNKYLSAAGVCSRREADRLIDAGLVLVDGVCADMGMKVTDANEIICDGKPVKREEKLVLLAVNKPVGVVCTTAEHKGETNIVDFVGYPTRVYPIGRLDKNSEGLILMTNFGDIADKILRGSNYHEKEYIVRINGPVTLEFLEQMRKGVAILDTVTRSCTVQKISRDTFRIILTQGLNRQIRRMCEALGYRVTHLQRVRVMNIKLGNLPLGQYREVQGEELETLLKHLKA